MGWFRTLVKVTHAATGAFLKNTGQSASSTQINADTFSTEIGVLRFTTNVEAGQTKLKNNSGEAQYVYFSATNNDGSLSSKHLIIAGHDEQIVTEDMSKYIEGQITYAPYNGEGTKDILSFTAETMFNRSLTLNDDDSAIQYVLEQNKEETQLIFTSDKEFEAFEMSFVDKNGISFQVSDLKIDAVRNFYEARVDIPKGCSQKLPYTNLQLQVTIPKETSQLIQAELARRSE